MADWRATGLDSSREWRTILPLAIVLIVFRSAIFVFWPQSYFDSDQAIFGLMAKHIAEGRAFPLFMYGQTYMLAAEAWLAANRLGHLDVRFDVIAIDGVTLTHHESAF